MKYGTGMDWQKQQEEYIRQMQESYRRQQERQLYEAIYSPSQNQNQVGDGSASGSGGGGDPNFGLSENNYVDDYVDDYFE